MYSSNRNNKNFMIIGIIIVFFIVALIAVGIILYLKTDIFKTDEELFQRQFLQNVEVINNLGNISIENEYRKLLEENSFNEDTELSLKYLDGEEKEDNFIGNITGIKNNQSNISFKDIKFDFGTTNVMNMTYLKENNIYGIRFIEGTKFATIDTDNDITAVLKYFGIEDIIDSGKINAVNLSDLLVLSNEEIEQLEKQYLTTILQNIIKENYSSEKEKVVTLNNNESIVTDSYMLSLSEQQVETIYENILSQITEDEIILSKLESIDNKIKEIGIKLEKSVKTYFTEIINQKINNIDIKSGLIVTIYEVDGTTVRTTIEYDNKIFGIDINNSNEIYITYSNGENVQDTAILIKKENNILQINYEDYNNTVIGITRNLNINSNDIESITNFKYSNSNIKNLEISIDRNIKIGIADEIPTSFEKSGKVLLNDYDEKSTAKNLEALKNRIIKLIREKRDKTSSVLLNYIIQYNNQLEENEKTEEENKRKKFNNKFELYEGEKQERNIVSNLLDEAGKNMSNYQMIGNNKIKIYIEEGKDNTDLVAEIKNKIFTEEEKRYNIKMYYDKNAKINEIIIEVVELEEGQ